MKNPFRPVLSLLLVAILGVSAGAACSKMIQTAAAATADTPAPAPSGIATSPGVAAPVVHNPATDPGAYEQDVMTAYKGGQWLMLGVLLALGLDAALLFAAKKWPDSVLSKIITPLTIFGSVLMAMAAGIAPGVSPDYRKLLAVALGAALVYLMPKSATAPAVTQ